MRDTKYRRSKIALSQLKENIHASISIHDCIEIDFNNVKELEGYINNDCALYIVTVKIIFDDNACNLKQHVRVGIN